MKGVAEVREKIGAAVRATAQQRREARQAQAAAGSRKPGRLGDRAERPRLEAGAAPKGQEMGRKPRAGGVMDGRALMAAVSEMQLLRERLGPKLERCVACPTPLPPPDLLRGFFSLLSALVCTYSTGSA